MALGEYWSTVNVESFLLWKLSLIHMKPIQVSFISEYISKNLNWKLIFLFLTTRLKRIIFFLSFCQLKWKIKVSIDRFLFHTIWGNNYISYSIISEVMFIKVQSLKYFVYIYHHNCNKLSTIQLLYFFQLAIYSKQYHYYFNTHNKFNNLSKHPLLSMYSLLKTNQSI